MPPGFAPDFAVIAKEVTYFVSDREKVEGSGQRDKAQADNES